jgi:hypothetical protein
MCASIMVKWFAAPLFRLALTAALDLRFQRRDTSDDQDRERHAKRSVAFAKHQFVTEDAIHVADERPAGGVREAQEAP